MTQATREPGWLEHQLTAEQAIAFDKSGVWKDWTDDQIVRFQLWTQMLCMPFDRFHEAVENVLGRPVYTHEFGSKGWRGLQLEYLGEKPPPTFDEILSLIPADKIILCMPPEEHS